MSRVGIRLGVLLPLVLVCVTACTTVPHDIEPPKITIANIVPKDIAVFEQRFDVQLRIQNPNDQELGINGLRCDIEFNDKELAMECPGKKSRSPASGRRW